MTAVPYVDWAGIGCLVGAQLFHQRSGGALALVGLNQRVLEVLKIAVVDTLFNLYGTTTRPLILRPIARRHDLLLAGMCGHYFKPEC